MRYLYLCVDFSSAMLAQEPFYPTRVQVVLTQIQRFAQKFFEQNPLSQLGVIACREKRAEKICGFASESGADYADFKRGTMGHIDSMDIMESMGHIDPIDTRYNHRNF